MYLVQLIKSLLLPTTLTNLRLNLQLLFNNFLIILFLFLIERDNFLHVIWAIFLSRSVAVD